MQQFPAVFLIALLVGTVVNAALLQARANTLAARRPTLADGYRRLARGGSIAGAIPVFAMVAAELSGNSILAGGAGTIAFAITAGVLVTLNALWILFWGGAGTLAQHGDLIRIGTTSTLAIKVLTILVTLGAVGGAIMLSQAPFSA